MSTEPPINPNVTVRMATITSRLDLATIIGLVAALAFIAMALSLGGAVRSFANLPSFLIVIGGTVAVTVMSYSMGDLGKTGAVIGQTFATSMVNHRDMARQLLDLAMFVRAKGPVALQQYDQRLKSTPFLMRAMRLVADAVAPEEIDRILSQEIDAVTARHEHSVGMIKRAAEVAPAMGLIGTLVGLVQMLSQLSDPSSIGPSMAVALITTFYGAILSTVILSPLAIKLESRNDDEFIIKTLILQAALSMARKENPRRLELILNTTLAPQNRISYF